MHVSAVNHVRGSGNVVRWPQGFSCTLFAYQERSRDRSAESTHARCRFRTSSGSFHSFVVRTSKIRGRNSSKAREMHRNAACFEPRSLYRSVIRCNVFCAETNTAKPLYSIGLKRVYRLLGIHSIKNNRTSNTKDNELLSAILCCKSGTGTHVENPPVCMCMPQVG